MLNMQSRFRHLVSSNLQQIIDQQQQAQFQSQPNDLIGLLKKNMGHIIQQQETNCQAKLSNGNITEREEIQDNKAKNWHKLSNNFQSVKIDGLKEKIQSTMKLKNAKNQANIIQQYLNNPSGNSSINNNNAADYTRKQIINIQDQSIQPALNFPLLAAKSKTSQLLQAKISQMMNKNNTLNHRQKKHYQDNPTARDINSLASGSNLNAMLNPHQPINRSLQTNKKCLQTVTLQEIANDASSNIKIQVDPIASLLRKKLQPKQRNESPQNQTEQMAQNDLKVDKIKLLKNLISAKSQQTQNSNPQSHQYEYKNNKMDMIQTQKPTNTIALQSMESQRINQDQPIKHKIKPSILSKLRQKVQNKVRESIKAGYATNEQVLQQKTSTIYSQMLQDNRKNSIQILPLKSQPKCHPLFEQYQKATSAKMSVEFIEIQSDKEDHQPPPKSKPNPVYAYQANGKKAYADNQTLGFADNDEQMHLFAQNINANKIKKTSKKPSVKRQSNPNKSKLKSIKPFNNSLIQMEPLPAQLNKNINIQFLKDKILNNKAVQGKLQASIGKKGRGSHSDGEGSSSSEESKQYIGNTQKSAEKIQLDKTMLNYNKTTSSKCYANFYVIIQPLKDQEVDPRITFAKRAIIQSQKPTLKTFNQVPLQFRPNIQQAKYHQYANDAVVNIMNKAQKYQTREQYKSRIINQIYRNKYNSTKLAKKAAKIPFYNAQMQTFNQVTLQTGQQIPMRYRQYSAYELAKRPQPPHKQAQSKQYHANDHFQSQNTINYSSFAQRRSQKQGQPIDLGVLSLDQIVEQCYVKDIVSQQLYVEYINNSSKDKIEQFIHYFIENNLKAWNFKQLKITIMDHRRLAQLLKRLHPDEYTVCAPEALNRDVKQFLVNLYELDSADYQKLLETLDNTSKIIFWSTLNIKYQKVKNVPVKILSYDQKIDQTSEQILDKKAINKINILKRPIQSVYVQLLDSEEEEQDRYKGKLSQQKLGQTKKSTGLSMQTSKKTGKQMKSQNPGRFTPQRYIEPSNKRIF